MNGFENILKEWRNFYFIPPLMYLVELATIIIAILYVRGTVVGRFFLYYLLFDFLIFNVDEAFVFFSKPEPTFVIVTNTLVGLIELLAYSLFFSHAIVYEKSRKIIKISSIFYFFLAIIYIIIQCLSKEMAENYFFTSIPAFEFFLLLFPCIIYFRQLFVEQKLIDLFNRPSFWITTGVFFYAIISIPFYLTVTLLLNSVHPSWHLFAAFLFYLPFTINFLFLIKAFLCKRPLTI
jgi:hypothetical protein